VYDGLFLTIDGNKVPLTTDEHSTSGQANVGPNQTVALHVAYRSQGLDTWRYKLADGVAQVQDFNLAMHTNFKDIDFADDTLSPNGQA